MREAVNKLKDTLSGRGKVICEFTGDCYLCFLKLDKGWYTVAISQGKSLYAKIAPYEKVAMAQNCEEVLASPIGLYVFSDDPEELVNDIITKVGKLRG